MKFLHLLKSIDYLFLLLVILCGLALFTNLGSFEIQKWDELTNIQVVRESSGLNLYYEGAHFFEKPPVWYWLAGLLTNLFGDNYWVYRLPSSLSGSCIVFLIYSYLSRRFNCLSAFFAACCFLIIPHNIILNAGSYFSSHTFRTADLDALQIFLIFLAFLLLHTSRRFWLLSCVLLGIGFLVKGPLVLLFLLLNSIYFISDKTEVRNKIILFLSGLAIFAIIVLPWHLYMILTFGNEFSDVYFNYHIVSRIQNELEGHKNSLGYILKVFFDIRVNVLWPLFVIALLKRQIYKYEFIRYSILNILSVLALLTTVETKLAWYVLPVYPFVCLVIGVFVFTIRRNTI